MPTPPVTVRYTGINHVAMATRDMDATIRFWRDLLGMRLIAGMGRPGQRQYFLAVSGRDMVTFFEWDGVEPLPEKDHGYPVRGPFGFDHVSFGVESAEDLCRLKARIDAAGFWVSEIIDHGFLHSIYAFDPNGIPIEFSWEVPEVDLRRAPALKDRRPGTVALEGPDPVPGHWPEPGKPPPDDCFAYPGDGADEFGPGTPPAGSRRG
ncbi:VOC family protein [Dissulfurirhabdus thermomarina]|uniref:VOC family protein n=1 Tax=Dissulfurirhabdus thermomarina TaxID=1765737 RepID=A0A6N9TST2_DISTH|nr:VOC family protein [Dissulfurirhabdus thermomarina]NDY43143.1 VOC family protein [Dissulfurirhabdus thermomarina]NMX23989.1 VOC family protein [Dissulfurirhabdus thermomarina]